MEPINKISSWMEKPSYKDTLQKFKEFYKRPKAKKDKKESKESEEKKDGNGDDDNLIGWA